MKQKMESYQKVNLLEQKFTSPPSSLTRMLINAWIMLICLYMTNAEMPITNKH